MSYLVSYGNLLLSTVRATICNLERQVLATWRRRLSRTVVYCEAPRAAFCNLVAVFLLSGRAIVYCHCEAPRGRRHVDPCVFVVSAKA